MKLSAEELHDVLLIFREHLLPCWRRLHVEAPHGMPLAFQGPVPEVPSSLMCQQTTAFIYKQFAELGIEDVELCGGSMRHAKPLQRKDPSRRDVDIEGYVWSGHYWLEHNGLILDITKDQFGWEFSEIHDTGDSGMIYWKRPGFFPESHLGMFAAAVSEFEGAGNPSVKLSFDQAMERAAEMVGTPAARVRG
jgi:hypothetical protein